MNIHRANAWRHLDSLTKPSRSLGRLEELAVRLCEIQQTVSPVTRPRRLVLFAGDHGVAQAGVTQWPSAVTGLMIQTICSGKAASTVFARQSQTETVLVNVGSLDLPAAPIAAEGITYRDERVRAGSRNLADESALTVDEFDRALEVGRQEGRKAARDGIRVVLAGEMGIGNTTPAACLAMLLANVAVGAAVGRGAGADEATLMRKRAVVEAAVERSRRLWPIDSKTALAAVAGFEIVAMAGFYMEASTWGLTTILDGYVASAGALIAEHLQPGTWKGLIAAHESAEPGHGGVLRHLGLEAFLNWHMRLGEGTGALLLLPMLDAAAAMCSQMATLKSLGLAAGEPT